MAEDRFPEGQGVIRRDPNEDERFASAAYQTGGLKVSGRHGPPPGEPRLQIAAKTLSYKIDNANDLADRLCSLATRLCGSQPTAEAEDEVRRAPDGAFEALLDDLGRLDRVLHVAEGALRRIERDVYGDEHGAAEARSDR